MIVRPRTAQGASPFPSVYTPNARAKMFAIGASTRVAAVNAAAPARASAAARSRAAPSSSTALVGRSGAIFSIRAASARRFSPVHAHPRGLTVVARVANTTPPGGPGGDAGDTRLSSGVSGIVRSIRGNVSKNFTKLPWALVALLIGFAMTAYFPHPESPGDAPICLTIVLLAELLSSVLY